MEDFEPDLRRICDLWLMMIIPLIT